MRVWKEKRKKNKKKEKEGDFVVTSRRWCLTGGTEGKLIAKL